MLNHKPGSTACGVQVASQDSSQAQFQQLKLALDVHAASIVVVRMIVGAKPPPPQSFKPADFLVWVKKQVTLAKAVISCYEAGPTVLWLHRQLAALGIRNYVVCPACLDERHGGVNNDRTDALELATRLDRYLAANDRALAVARVPTEAEEQKRAHKRQRHHLHSCKVPNAKSWPAADPLPTAPRYLRPTRTNVIGDENSFDGSLPSAPVVEDRPTRRRRDRRGRLVAACPARFVRDTRRR